MFKENILILKDGIIHIAILTGAILGILALFFILTGPIFLYTDMNVEWAMWLYIPHLIGFTFWAGLEYRA